MNSTIALICAGTLLLQVASGASRPSRAAVAIPPESAGWDRVLNGLLSALDTVDVLALGEAHGRREDAELRLRLVQHPQFPAKVRCIVTESAEPALIEAVNAINRRLPPAQAIRLLTVTPSDNDPRDRNEIAVSMLRNEALLKGEKALVIFGSGHLWHREGGITSRLQQIGPGRVFVAEVLAPFESGLSGPAFVDLEKALRSFEQTLTSAERPVLVSLKGTAGARHVANPFYLGQAMLSAETTLGDLDDAVILFGRTAGSTLPGSNTTIVDTSLAALPLMAVEYRTSRLQVAEINERLRQNNIRLRLDFPIDGLTMCGIREVLGDLMAEKGFGVAEIAHQSSVVRGPDGAKLLKVTFAITDGERAARPPSVAAKLRLSPSARCNR